MLTLASRLARGLCLLLLVIAPAGAAHAAPPLSTYGNLPGFEMATMSASGDRVALIGTLAEKRRLLVLGKDKALLATADIAPDAKVLSLNWAGDQFVLMSTSVTSSTGGDFTASKIELVAMTVLPLDTGKPWVVFGGDRLVRGGIMGFHGVRQREGKWYGYFGGMTYDQMPPDPPKLLNTNPVLYEVDLQTSLFKDIAPRAAGQDAYRGWLIDESGTPSIMIDYDSRQGNWSISNKQKDKLASGVQKLGSLSLIGFGRTPGTFIYSREDDETGVEHWYEAPLTGGAGAEILADQDIANTFFDRRNKQLIGYRQQGDLPSYTFFEPYKAKVVAAVQKAFPNLGVHLMSWNDPFNRLVVQTEGTGDPGTWWIVDIKTGAADQLGKSYVVPAKDVGPTKMISYKAGDGLDIAAVLTLPPGREAKNLPVIVLPHGGPAARDFPGFDWWAQALATRGYAVLQPNFRGSTGYGAEFERAGHGQWGRQMQTDISDGLAQLVKDGIADPKRACIVGASYGGYAALAGVTLQQGLYRCAVSVAGVSDLAKMVRTDMSDSGGNRALIRSLKEELGSGKDMSAVSPIKFAAKADAPVLLIHGKDDTVVDFGQSNDMATALRRAGKPVELVLLPETDHWLLQGKTRLAMLEATVAFLQKHNPPDVVAP